MKLPTFNRDWPKVSPTIGINPIVLQSNGCDVVYLFLSFVPPFKASEVLDLAVAVPFSHKYQLT